uniref:Uncharacterized protein n=1 Tax=Bracon brevicornis TaxID=1563983 RepID=A0A6V7LML8_9HYME
MLPSVSFNGQLDSSDQLFSQAPPHVAKGDAEVKVETDFLKPRFTAFITNESELSTLTGIESFKILTTITEIMTTLFGNRLDNHNIQMNIHDRIVMTYFKLKQNLSYSCMAVLCHCYPANQCRKVFYEMIQMLSACLKVVIHLSSRETISRNLPKCFEGFEDTRVVVDCT